MMEVSPSAPKSTTRRTRILKATISDNTQAAKNFAYFINDYFINAVLQVRKI